MVGMNGTKTYSVVFGEGDFLGLDSPAFSFERDGASESFFFCGSGVRGDISFSCDCGEDVLSVFHGSLDVLCGGLSVGGVKRAVVAVV